MNRREFMKALAGLGVLCNPLTRWFLWRPKADRRRPPIVLECPEYIDVSETSTWHILVDGGLPTEIKGKTIFVDLVAGDDTNDGLTPETAVTWGGWPALIDSREWVAYLGPEGTVIEEWLSNM